MAEIRSFWLVRHLRSEPSAHVLVFRRGAVAASGRGLSCWFLPMSTSIAEVPVDDRPVALSVHARSIDFQDVSVQGVIGWRVIDPARAAERIDFSIDLVRGVHLEEPLDRVALVLSQLAQQHAARWIAGVSLRDALRDGSAQIRERVHAALSADASVTDLGIEITSVRIQSVLPTPDLERALEAPMRERIQQESDEAAFARRALAVEKERAIQENELQNRIELARREEQLIAQDGANAKKRATADAEGKRIAAEGEASRTRLASEAQADALRVVEAVRLEAERTRMDIQRAAPTAVLFALAARELAGKLQRIDHVHVGGELAPLLTELVTAGTRALESK
jgi:regulator of protease activity HflC (stomatin/prohibitin superfamily)